MQLNSFFGLARYAMGTLVALAVALPSFGQTTVPAAEDWRVDFNSWIWALGVDGDIGAKGRTSDVSADFLDIVDQSDSLFALSGRLEVGKGRWGGFIDGIYADIGVEDQSGPLGRSDIDVTFEIGMVDFGLMYRLGDWTPRGEASRSRHRTTLDLYAGGRYTSVDLEVDADRFDGGSTSEEWLDPIVGARLVLPLAEHWHLRANGDIGGFEVESDFTWSTTAVFGYDFTLFNHPATFYAGYRAIGQDFTEGSGADAFVWDVVLHGPIIGLGFQF